MALERLATQSEADGCYAFELDQLTPASAATSSTVSINTQPLIRDIARAMQLGHPVALIARRFHRTMAEMIATTVNLLRDETGIANVVLSGGVFCNALLCAEASARLRQHGFRVYLHHRVPPNDGGLCLGQLAVAAAHESFGER